ncbi:MAG: flagellar basal body-associated FliL family protein [Rhodobacteraceae bacterium]|nr:flagellar basal body-associated FliL family protein [Paracoccaceae bacterium]
MKRLLLPVLLALAGLGAGVGAGLALRPPTEAEPAAGGPAEGGGAEEGAAPAGGAAAPAEGGHAPAAGADAAAGREFVKLNNQFVVPVVGDGRVTSLVVLSVSLEVAAGGRETVFAHEPKLRDAFLQVLFAHANAGGFDGNFTAASALRSLRTGLLEAAQSVLGSLVSDVLIIDMMRQDS